MKLDTPQCWTRHWGKPRRLRCSLERVWWDFYWPAGDRRVRYPFQAQTLLFNNKTSTVTAAETTPYNTTGWRGICCCVSSKALDLPTAGIHQIKRNTAFLMIFNSVTTMLWGRLPWHLLSKKQLIEASAYKICSGFPFLLLQTPARFTEQTQEYSGLFFLCKFKTPGDRNHCKLWINWYPWVSGTPALTG